MRRTDHARSPEGCVLFSTAMATAWHGNNRVSGEKQSSQHLLYENVTLPEALEFFARTCCRTGVSFFYKCRASILVVFLSSNHAILLRCSKRGTE